MQTLDNEYLLKYDIINVNMISELNSPSLINIKFKNGDVIFFKHSDYNTLLNIIDGKVNEYYINKRFEKIQKIFGNIKNNIYLCKTI